MQEATYLLKKYDTESVEGKGLNLMSDMIV